MRRLLIGIMMLAGVRTDGRPARDRPAQPPAEDGQHDFDFIIGTWKIHNRRLTKILSGSTQWYEFDSHSVERPLFGGAGNLEEWTGDSPTGHIDGITVRVYNPASHEWSLLWVSKRAGTIDKPMIGHFQNGRGEFFDQEQYEGRTIFVRFVYADVTPTSARWEQAFSVDGGKTWETNWTMDFSRQSS